MVEKTLEICKVRPPLGSSTDIYLPLTLFDLANLRNLTPEVLFFYEHRQPQTIFSNLKHTLSQTLQYFLPLAGNLVWPCSSLNFVVRYNEGDGVLLTIAESDDDFYYLSGKKVRECRDFRPFVARMVGSHSQVPALALKVTLFPNQGFCIGLTYNHGVLDGKSLLLFMNAWAWISKFGENLKGLNHELVPVFDRKYVRERYTDLEDSYIEFLKRNVETQNKLSILESELLPNIVRGTFELSGLDVRKLKELAHARLAKHEKGKVSQGPYISTFVVVYAYVIHCLIKAKGSTIQRVAITFAFDCRNLLEPPLPENYFGNCIGRVVTYCSQEEFSGMDPTTLFMNLVTKIMKGLEERLLTGPKEWLSNRFEAITDDNTTIVHVAGSSRFEFQNIDIGWGKPRKIYSASNDGSGGIYLTNVDKGGIEFDISLISNEMNVFSSAYAYGLRHMINRRSAAL